MQAPLGETHARGHDATLARLAEHFLQALEREREPAGCDVFATEVGEQRVVAAAGGEARSDALRIALEDDAGVVVKRVDDREVKRDAASLEQVADAIDEKPQLSGATLLLGHASLGKQGIHAVDDVDAAADARDGADGAGGRGVEALLGCDQLVEADEVGAVHEVEGGLDEVCRGGAGREQRGERRHRAKGDAPRGDVEGGEGLGEQAHDLDLRRGAVGTDELDSELRELSRLTLE